MAFDRIIKTVSARRLALAPALALAAVSVAAPAPAPMLGGSILSLAALGGFIVLRRRAAPKAGSEAGADHPTIDD